LKKLYGNAPEASPFAIYEDFILGEAKYGPIWVVSVNLRLARICGDLLWGFTNKIKFYLS